MIEEPNSREYILTNDALKLNSDIQKFVNKNCNDLEYVILRNNDGTMDKLKFENKKMFDVTTITNEMRDFIGIKSNLLRDVLIVKSFVR